MIYALALGAVERGLHYVEMYPGRRRLAAVRGLHRRVFMAGARLMEITRPDRKERRRKSDFAALPQS